MVSVGRLPEHSADGKNQDMKDAVQELTASAKGRFQFASGFPEMLSVLDQSLEPDLQVVPPTRQLLVLHRQQEGKDIFFVFNNSDKPWEGRISVKAGGNVEIWNPLDGSIQPAGVEEKNHRSLVELRLDGYAGGFAVFR